MKRSVPDSLVVALVTQQLDQKEIKKRKQEQKKKELEESKNNFNLAVKERALLCLNENLKVLPKEVLSEDFFGRNHLGGVNARAFIGSKSDHLKLFFPDRLLLLIYLYICNTSLN